MSPTHMPVNIVGYTNTSTHHEPIHTVFVCIYKHILIDLRFGKQVYHMEVRAIGHFTQN